MMNRRKSNIFVQVLMFLIGLFCTTNAVYFAVVGNTPISFIFVPTILLFIFYFISAKNKNKETYHIPFSFTAFFIFAVLSGFSVAFFNIENIIQWAKGIIVLFSYFLLIVTIITFAPYKDNLLWGIVFGILVNAVISLLSFFLYKRGVIFSLSSFFPASNISEHVTSNSFAAMGLFCEQGHLMRFLAIFVLPALIFCKAKNKYLFYIVLLSSSVLLISTRSASLGIFLFGLIIYVIYLCRKKLSRLFLIILSVSILFLIGLFLRTKVSFLDNLYDSFFEGIADLFSSANGSTSYARWSGMSYAFVLIKEYPFVGCGWNTMTQLFIQNGWYGGVYEVHGSYSAALTLIGEIGIFSIAFFFFLFSCFFKLIKCKNNMLAISLAFSLVIYFFLFCLTDFGIDPSSSVFLAIVLLEIKNTKKARFIKFAGRKSNSTLLCDAIGDGV